MGASTETKSFQIAEPKIPQNHEQNCVQNQLPLNDQDPSRNKDVVVVVDVESPQLRTHEIPYKGSTSSQEYWTHHATPSNDLVTIQQNEIVIDAQESSQNRVGHENPCKPPYS
ncbi:hypothetical protein ACH5RR_015539 [Cinchona calisaya]|uniref:Uncharacterized protein n=1 Tax=Cinchona calisaya TaxID=153742 RepID=A0ABD2ZWW5_9GENT